jgi:DNA-nicking Smr family endonuclease
LELGLIYTQLLSQVLDTLDDANSVSKPPSELIEAEYHRLRRLAHKSGDKRSFWLDEARANRTKPSVWRSCIGKAAYHGEQERTHHRRASDFIFRIHNMWDDPRSEEIDLHGQYPNEVGKRLRDGVSIARSQGLSRLRVVVGRGNHSPSGICVIREKTLDFCEHFGLVHRFESGNSGAIWVSVPHPTSLQLRVIRPSSVLDVELQESNVSGVEAQQGSGNLQRVQEWPEVHQRAGVDMDVSEDAEIMDTTIKSIGNSDKTKTEGARMNEVGNVHGNTSENQVNSREKDGLAEQQDDGDKPWAPDVFHNLYWIDCQVHGRPLIINTIISSRGQEFPHGHPPRCVVYGPNTLRMQTLHLELHAEYGCVGFLSQSMSKIERESVVQDFQNDKLRIIVSTWWDHGWSGTEPTLLFTQMVFICGLPVRHEYLGPYETQSDEKGALPELVGLFDSKEDNHLKENWEAGMAANGYNNIDLDIREIIRQP